jgi:hypothetical protein
MSDLARHYRIMSAEDRRTFDRWLKLNAAAGLIIASGLLAMAWIGSESLRATSRTYLPRQLRACASRRRRVTS